MSTATPNPPVTPSRPSAIGTQNGTVEEERKLKASSSQIDLNETKKFSEALALREGPDKVEAPASQPPPAIKNPPTSQVNQDHSEHDAEPNIIGNDRPVSPHALDAFGWDAFHARYDQAMAETKATEETLLHEFNDLANYFAIWAAAASEHDDERALKRLRTRETYVQAAEQSLDEKKRHYSQVVEAFRNALALLGGP